MAKTMQFLLVSQPQASKRHIPSSHLDSTQILPHLDPSGQHHLARKHDLGLTLADDSDTEASGGVAGVHWLDEVNLNSESGGWGGPHTQLKGGGREKINRSHDPKPPSQIATEAAGALLSHLGLVDDRQIKHLPIPN